MTELREKQRIPVDQLTWEKSLESIVGRSTGDAEPQKEIIGQDRAVKAIKLGLAMKSFGYNIFVSGRNGSGRIQQGARRVRFRPEFSTTLTPPQLCHTHAPAKGGHPHHPDSARPFEPPIYGAIHPLDRTIA